MMSTKPFSSLWLNRVGEFAKANRGSIQTILTICLTLSLEGVFQRIVFRCPCNNPNRKLYGGIFLTAPALTLWAIGILLNKKLWRMTTGCCFSSQSRYGCRPCCYYFIGISCHTLIAPSAWIFMALLDGSYYACIMSENPCAHGNETDAKHAKEMHLDLISQSQIIGWLFLVITIMITLIGFFIARCFSPFTYYQRKYLMLCRENEMEKFEEKSVEIAKLVASHNVAMFFDCEQRTKKDWDSISDVSENVIKTKTSSNRNSIVGPYHSSLDKWSKEHADKDLDSDKKSKAKTKEMDNAAGETDNVTSGENEELIPLNPILSVAAI